jgi:putative copper export protein
MGDVLTTLMRWLHLSSVAALIGGILYARFVIAPSESFLPGEAHLKLDERAAAHFRPVVFTAISCLLVSGVFNLLTHPGHSSLYHALLGVKFLLALHVFAVAILIAQPGNKKRNRQMFGAAISGLTVILISNYLRGIA